MRDYASYSPFVASGPVSVLVRQAIEKAGVRSAHTGKHVFRHTLATELLRNGASLDKIGRVLRQRDPDSTAIYAKVDIDALRQLALAWPGGVRGMRSESIWTITSSCGAVWALNSPAVNRACAILSGTWPESTQTGSRSRSWSITSCGPPVVQPTPKLDTWRRSVGLPST